MRVEFLLNFFLLKLLSTGAVSTIKPPSVAGNWLPAGNSEVEEVKPTPLPSIIANQYIKDNTSAKKGKDLIHVKLAIFYGVPPTHTRWKW